MTLVESKTETLVSRMAMVYEAFSALVPDGEVSVGGGYDYVSTDALRATLNAALRRAGLALTNLRVDYRGDTERGVCTVAFSLFSEDEGSELVHLSGIGGGYDAPGKPKSDGTPGRPGEKAPQKAMANALKAALVNGLCMATKDDVAALFERIAAADSLSALNELKPAVGALRDHARFGELVAACKAVAAKLEEMKHG